MKNTKSTYIDWGTVYLCNLFVESQIKPKATSELYRKQIDGKDVENCYSHKTDFGSLLVPKEMYIASDSYLI